MYIIYKRLSYSLASTNVPNDLLGLLNIYDSLSGAAELEFLYEQTTTLY